MAFATKASLIVSAGISAALFTGELDRSPPTVILEYNIRTPQVEQGGMLYIDVKVARFRICDAHLKAHIIDSEGTLYEYPPAVVKGSDRNTYTVDRALPKHLAPGPAVYQPNTTYACTAMQRVFPFLRLPRNDGPVRFEITEPLTNRPD